MSEKILFVQSTGEEPLMLAPLPMAIVFFAILASIRASLPIGMFGCRTDTPPFFFWPSSQVEVLSKKLKKLDQAFDTLNAYL